MGVTLEQLTNGQSGERLGDHLIDHDFLYNTIITVKVLYIPNPHYTRILSKLDNIFCKIELSNPEPLLNRIFLGGSQHCMLYMYSVEEFHHSKQNVNIKNSHIVYIIFNLVLL